MPPPNAHTIQFHPPEPAIKQTYDANTRKWNEEQIMVQLATEPFAEGTLRFIYHLKDLSRPDSDMYCCAKVSKDANEPRNTYYLDVQMQCTAKRFADKFNAEKPPKSIDFVVPWALEFKRRYARNGQGRLVMNIEPYLPGKYIKHSNNYGFVSKHDRNTPQAFSHYTYQSSRGQMLVCDIQGVEDMYTDPQIHSVAMQFGKADLGQDGIQKFFTTHQCNAICQFLKLQPLSGKQKAITYDAVAAIGSETGSRSSASNNSERKTSPTSAPASTPASIPPPAPAPATPICAPVSSPTSAPVRPKSTTPAAPPIPPKSSAAPTPQQSSSGHSSRHPRMPSHRMGGPGMPPFGMPGQMPGMGMGMMAQMPGMGMGFGGMPGMC
eukprot:NODE_520_length_1402_cov_68.511373_g403_i1.p1 GENE.NODE_520_length_1402_cov_68.511373_g403_i1~~NODE_520_length_1402_cov_68.511373_g403_i1.p1  ORF type:complete len:379 (-),score=64.58 NODE_520_length_1402_cov_68.511373_g403_i1:170-1306(-)